MSKTKTKPVAKPTKAIAKNITKTTTTKAKAKPVAKVVAPPVIETPAKAFRGRPKGSNSFVTMTLAELSGIVGAADIQQIPVSKRWLKGLHVNTSLYPDIKSPDLVSVPLAAAQKTNQEIDATSVKIEAHDEKIHLTLEA
jgi:hypothetical protein